MQNSQYKDTPIGKIPADWEVTDINSLGEVYSGGTPDTDNESFWNGDINWCTPTDITKLNGSKYIGETIAKITENGLKNSSAKLLPVGSLIVCTRATIGKAAISIEEITTNQGFKNIVPNPKKVDVEFLYYLITNSENRLLKLGNGSTFLEISKSDFEKFKLPIPPLPEQQRIAEVLSTWDKAIQCTEQLIRQKEQRKKWLMQKLLTGKIRLKGFSGEWKEYRLKSICKISKGEQLNKIDLEKTGIYPSYSGGITPSGYTDKWNTNENTIIISEGGNSCGYVNYVTSKFWCGGHCYALLNLKEIINRDFLFQALKHQEHKIMKLRVGSGLPNVQKKDLENYPIVIPSIEEQTAIAEVLQAADKEIELLKAKAEKLKEQKKGLMQMLLTGKKRFKI